MDLERSRKTKMSRPSKTSFSVGELVGREVVGDFVGWLVSRMRHKSLEVWLSMSLTIQTGVPNRFLSRGSETIGNGGLFMSEQYFFPLRTMHCFLPDLTPTGYLEGSGLPAKYPVCFRSSLEHLLRMRNNGHLLPRVGH